MPTVDEAVDGWIRHFASADRSLQWTAAEQELSMPLLPGVILAGRIDARGLSQQAAYSKKFFGEWKSMSKFAKSGWREKWRFHPQSLTYGLLVHQADPDCNLFTIRVAFKSDPPTFDHEWFSYSSAELETWRLECIRIAKDIISLRSQIRGLEGNPNAAHWPLNPLSCYKWGPKYPCPYVHACSHQEWNVPQPGAPLPYIPHLKVMQDAAAQPKPPLVLDATAITAYLECPEAFRRRYIRGEDEVPSEALQFGSSFHAMLDSYYRQLINGARFAPEGASAWPNHSAPQL